MTCEELLRAMNEYVDGNIDPGICEGFAEHLADCNPCQVVVDNIRQTITLYRAGQPYAIPADLQMRLRGQLRQRFAEKFGKRA